VDLTGLLDKRSKVNLYVRFALSGF